MSDSSPQQDWRSRLLAPAVKWLGADSRPLGMPRNDFARLCEHLRPADIVLVEGRTRISGVIQSVTLSAWTHAALCVGRLADLEESEATRRLRAEGVTDATSILLEAELGRGVHLSPVTRYAREHLRLCRPRELSATDAQAVVAYALARLGTPYNLRQIGDLLRFFFPYGLLPRRWRSTLFEAGHSDMARTICSTLIARGFASVRYPILPTIHRGADGDMVFHRRDARLITPRDFDHSPYFDVIKYPFFGDDVARYRELEWDDDTRP
ncbi:YiiX/YebB-like N1pC/P60 family cysteine hydrolase [Salinisphaera aquimarina]|uniref:YiiX/YebB-like N1pC/P60 family cysteine hydrolase n=1 Tax=Salinisphaera aquimarina TaxID=2094031 RepID=A0ABV7EPV8_9GAMM